MPRGELVAKPRGQARRDRTDEAPRGDGAARRRKVALKTVSMRLPEPDIEAAKDLAWRKGLPYQTYIKMLLHEAIERECHSG